MARQVRLETGSWLRGAYVTPASLPAASTNRGRPDDLALIGLRRALAAVTGDILTWQD